MSLGETFNKAASTRAAGGQWVSQHKPGQGRGTQTIHHWPNLMAGLISKHSLGLTACDGTGCSPTVPQTHQATWQMDEICGLSSESPSQGNSLYFIDRGKSKSWGEIREKSYAQKHLANAFLNLFFPQDGFSLIHSKSGKWHCVLTHTHYSIGTPGGEFCLYLPTMDQKFPKWK